MNTSLSFQKSFNPVHLPRPTIMGVLNLSPESFSDGGALKTEEDIASTADSMLSQGADILDIGGESTAPGRHSIPAHEELRRVRDTVSKLALRTTISVDTYRASTAAACLQLGATIINDVSAMRADPLMRDVIAEHRASVVLMYSKERDDAPHASDSPKHYTNIIQEICDFLKRRVDYALAGKIDEHRIILDPGMGRFVSPEEKHSWEILRRLEELVHALSPFPLLIGASRKGFLGGKLQERDAISQLVGLIAHQKGAHIIRTHCPEMAKQFFATWNLLFPPPRTNIR